MFYIYTVLVCKTLTFIDDPCVPAAKGSQMQSMHNDSKTDIEKDLLISQLREEYEYYKNAYEKLLNGIITKSFFYRFFWI